MKINALGGKYGISFFLPETRNPEIQKSREPREPRDA
jgi:hypothetical protein